MEFRQELLNAEMALRDLVDAYLKNRFGDQWADHSTIDPGIIEKARVRMDNLTKINNSLTKEYHLINYLNLDELGQIIFTYWTDYFQRVFGDLDTFKVYLSVLHRFSNSDLFGRPLLTHQKHLILGISGVIRNKIVAHRSEEELTNPGFPRIESVQDNLGNLWVPGKPKKLRTGNILLPGDSLELVVTASDPLDEPLEYRIFADKWQPNNVFLIEITPGFVGKEVAFPLSIKSQRKHHAYPNGYDDRVTFLYDILPKE